MKFPKLTNYIMTKKSRWSTFIVIILVALGLPYAGFSAVRGSTNSGSFNVSSHHPHGANSHGDHHRRRFFGHDRFDEVEVIVEQSQSAPTVGPEKPDKKRTYVQPRWLDGGYGVEILQPGHWIEPESSR